MGDQTTINWQPQKPRIPSTVIRGTTAVEKFNSSIPVASTSSGPVSILSIYAPTFSCAANTMDEFYEELETTIREISPTGHLHLRIDFTARIRLTKNPGPAPLATWCRSDYLYWSESIKVVFLLCFRHNQYIFF